MIRGSPYNPRSQGCVERIHSTIRKSLLTRFISNPNEFDLKNSLIEVMNNYNRTVYSTTMYTPNEVFYSESLELFNKVINNTIKKFNNIRKLGYNFCLNEKCLLTNHFIKTKQKNKFGYYYIIKNKVKKNKCFYRIYVKIINILGCGNYIIEILSDYFDYDL